MTDETNDKTSADAPNATLFPSGSIAAVKFDDWFYGPDGQQYNVAWGPINIIRARDLLGFEPKNAANCYVQVGYGPGAVILAGCRIHSALIADTMPVGRHVYAAPAEHAATAVIDVAVALPSSAQVSATA